MKDETKGETGPLRYIHGDSRTPGYIAGSEPGQFVAQMLCRDGKIDLGYARKNAQRIVQCWNCQSDLLYALEVCEAAAQDFFQDLKSYGDISRLAQLTAVVKKARAAKAKATRKT